MLRRTIQRTLSTTSTPVHVELKHLPYELGALEPVVSGTLMDFHYGKHHRTYVNNLNNLLPQAQEALAVGNIEKYNSLQDSVNFNLGGHLNHEFFWDTLAPLKEGGGVLPDADSDLHKMISAEWGNIESF